MTADVALTILQYFGINVSVNSNLCFQNNEHFHYKGKPHF